MRVNIWKSLKKFLTLNFLYFCNAKDPKPAFPILITSRCALLSRVFQNPSTKNAYLCRLMRPKLPLFNFVTTNILTVPRYFGESSKNVITTRHDGYSRPFVVSFGVKRFSLETISGTWEWKLPFSLWWRQPTI